MIKITYVFIGAMLIEIVVMNIVTGHLSLDQFRLQLTSGVVIGNLLTALWANHVYGRG